MRLILTLLALIAGCDALKLAIFVPNMANSQVQFNNRVAEALANAGHDVTMIMLSHLEDRRGSVAEIKPPKNVRLHDVAAIIKGATKAEMERVQASVIFKDEPFFSKSSLKVMKIMTHFMREGCRELLRHKEFLEWIKNEKFDLAFAHQYNSCPVGIIHYAKIPSWIWLSSGALMDHQAAAIGVPLISSYVPPMPQEATDEMTFYERTKSFIGHSLMHILVPILLTNEEAKMFREELNDPEFPHPSELTSKCQLVMANTNEVYDLPRPLLAKVVNIGGLGVGFSNAKPLTKEFQRIVDAGKGTVVFSFGSVAAADQMPEEWKTAFLDAFREFPEIQFVMRYVKDDIKDRLPPNVHISNWLPQKDLLLHNKTKAFITHGGYNSMQEAISAGVPLITIALFGDQPKNAKIAKKHGFAENIAKSTLSKETIVEALEKVLSSDKYSAKVKRLSAMVRMKPTQPEDLLVKWTEFVAEFKTLDNLVPAGQKLNFIQYHSLDVIAFLSTVIFLVLFIIFLIFRGIFCLLRRCFSGSKKQKNE